MAVILVAFIILIGVNTWMNSNTTAEPMVISSYWPTEEWRYATPAQMGMNPERLQDMVDEIESGSG